MYNQKSLASIIGTYTVEDYSDWEHGNYIYVISDTQRPVAYVGLTTRAPMQRWKEHFMFVVNDCLKDRDEALFNIAIYDRPIVAQGKGTWMKWVMLTSNTLSVEVVMSLPSESNLKRMESEYMEYLYSMGYYLMNGTEIGLQSRLSRNSDCPYYDEWLTVRDYYGISFGDRELSWKKRNWLFNRLPH